jgi:hypothetical protein
MNPHNTTPIQRLRQLIQDTATHPVLPRLQRVVTQNTLIITFPYDFRTIHIIYRDDINHLTLTHGTAVRIQDNEPMVHDDYLNDISLAMEGMFVPLAHSA